MQIKSYTKKGIKIKNEYAASSSALRPAIFVGRWNQEIRLKSGAHPGAVSAGAFYPRRKPAIGQKLRR